MALNIVLDKLGPYRPGDTISGQVELKSASDEAIASININFAGRCKVKIRKHDHYTTISYRSRGYYFSQHLSLYAEGKYKHKAGTYTFPFTFTIPTHASRRLISETTNTSKTPTSWRPPRQLTATGVLQPGVGHELESDLFRVKPPFRASALNALQPHPLPDSFACSHSGFPADFEGRVEYTLVASLTRPAGSILFAPKNLETSATISVKSFRPRTTRDLESSLQMHKSTHTMSTLRLLPSNMDRKLSFLEKTRSVLNSSTVPTCTFQVVIVLPRYISTSTNSTDTLPFTMIVSRLRLPQSNKAETNFHEIPSPIVKLTTFSFWIRARTLLRDNGKAAIDQNIDYEDRVLHAPRTGLEIDIPILDNGAEFDSSVMSELLALNTATNRGHSKAAEPRISEAIPKLDVGKILNLRLEPGLLPPDFSTYNIYRSYTLGYKLKLEALGESIDVSQDGIKIRVLQELAPPSSGTEPPMRRPLVPCAPPTPPSDNDMNNEKDGPFPPEPPPDANVGEDELPQYEYHGPEGPLPAFQS